jgi:hypothetical protein
MDGFLVETANVIITDLHKTREVVKETNSYPVISS